MVRISVEHLWWPHACTCFCTRRTEESSWPVTLFPSSTPQRSHKVCTDSHLADWGILGVVWSQLEQRVQSRGRKGFPQNSRSERQERAFMKDEAQPNPAPDSQTSQTWLSFIGKLPGTPGGKYDLGSHAGAGVRELRKVFKRPKEGENQLSQKPTRGNRIRGTWRGESEAASHWEREVGFPLHFFLFNS